MDYLQYIEILYIYGLHVNSGVCLVTEYFMPSTAVLLIHISVHVKELHLNSLLLNSVQGKLLECIVMGTNTTPHKDQTLQLHREHFERIFFSYGSYG